MINPVRIPAVRHSTLIWRFTQNSVLIFAFFTSVLSTGCIDQPTYTENQTQPPAFFNSPDRALEVLASKVSKASKEISCAFHGNTPFSNNEPISNPSTELLSAVIQKKLDPDIKITIILDQENRCQSYHSIYLQYPSQFDQQFNSGTISFTDTDKILTHCNSIPQPLHEQQYHDQMRNIGLPEGFDPYLQHQIIFTKKGAPAPFNLCVVDNSFVWLASDPPGGQNQSPGFTIIFEKPSEIFLERIKRELQQIAHGVNNNTTPSASGLIYHTNNTEVLLAFGPEDTPDKLLVENITKANETTFYSDQINISGNPFSLYDTFSQVAQGKLKTGFPFGLFLSSSFILDNGATTPTLHSVISTSSPLNHPGFRYQPCRTGHQRKTIHLATGSAGSSNKKQSFFYFNATGKKESTSHSLLLGFYDPHSAGFVKSLIESGCPHDNYSLPQNTGTQGPILPGTIVINELLWMGSVNFNVSSKISDEAIELYNNTTETVDISSLELLCSNDSTGLSGDTIIPLPAGASIDPKGYLVLARTRDHSIPKADIIINALSLPNTTRTCLLIDSSQQASWFYPAGGSGHLNNPAAKGVIIDQVLLHNLPAWNTNSSQLYSRTGYNTTKYNHKGDGARSMERLYPDRPGTELSNWHTNSFAPEDNKTIAAEYNTHTYHSLGYTNSKGPLGNQASGVVINEIHWMGSYDLWLNNFSSDEFIELYNHGATMAELGGAIFGCRTASTQKVYFTIPYGTRLAPGEYLIVSSFNTSFFTEGGSHPPLYGDFSILNTTVQCLLTDGVIDAPPTYGTDLNNNGVLDGNYDLTEFPGNKIDAAGDNMTQFQNSSAGINNTTLKIRRSAEKISPFLNGEDLASWSSNIFSPDYLHFMINPLYTKHTFASPGSKNSVTR